MTTTNAVPAREQDRVMQWSEPGQTPPDAGIYEIAQRWQETVQWFAEWDGKGWLPGASTPEQARAYAIETPDWYLSVVAASRRIWRKVALMAGTTTTSKETADG